MMQYDKAQNGTTHCDWVRYNNIQYDTMLLSLQYNGIQ